MEVTERDRQQLFAWFEEHMDPERAATMMELIPPVGASQLATKQDLSRELRDLEQRIDARLDAKLEAMRGSMLRTFGTWLLASQAAVIAAIGVFAGLG
jgi:hypothetical protein